jgi:hypothetical protein
VLKLIDELIVQQRNKILKIAKKVVPHITEEDLLQPNDFPILEMNPYFRHEEGILDGMMIIKTAILASQNNESCHKYESNGEKEPGPLV